MTNENSSIELVWAGFPELKKKFEDRIKRSMLVSPSSLVLNWGEYGSGKTHAAKYFGKPEVIEDLGKDSTSNPIFLIYITLPKGKNPAEGIFTSIIDKLDISQIRTDFSPHLSDLKAFIEGLSDNLHTESVLKAFFDSSIDSNDMKKYLYQKMTNSEIAKKLTSKCILRPINIDIDYLNFLSGLFLCLTFDKKIYSCVVLWVDEFEDMATMTNINVDKVNSFIRDIIDNTPNNLLIFLNLTQTTFFTNDDLGQYLSEAVISKIKECINFDLPTKSELLTYLKELFLAFRTDVFQSNIYPFENENVIYYIIENLAEISLRRFNEALNVTLELANLDGRYPIDEAYIKANKNDIIGWKSS